MKLCNAAYKNEILLSCYQALADQGFVRFRKENVDWPFEDGFHCWVGLNAGLYAEYVEIAPFAGVHSVKIEKLWTSIKRGKYLGKYDRGVATYGLHLGQIAPSERVFQFRRGVNLRTEATRLAELYFRVGVPFAKSLASNESILSHLRDRVEMLGGNPERFSSCLFLMGYFDEARTFVENFLPDHEEYFEGFAVPFLKMIEEELGSE
jgi:hypothetical protein